MLTEHNDLFFGRLVRLDICPEVHLVLHPSRSSTLLHLLEGQKHSERLSENVGLIQDDEREAIPRPERLAIAYSRSVAPKKKPRNALSVTAFFVVFISTSVRVGKDSSTVSSVMGGAAEVVMTRSNVCVPKAPVIPISSRIRRFVNRSTSWNLASRRRSEMPSFSVRVLIPLFSNLFIVAR
jgi:hypothetical protein